MARRESLPVGMAWSGERGHQDIEGETEHFHRVTVGPDGAIQTEEKPCAGTVGNEAVLKGGR